MIDDFAYEKWLEGFSATREHVDLSSRSEQTIRLYLDDVRPCPVGWTVARSYEEAIELMKQFKVSRMSLDPDLGACKACLKENEELILCDHVKSGYDFVAWMRRTGVWPEQKPTVHSMNPIGALKMRQEIEIFFPK